MRQIYLDNAATSYPKPDIVKSAVNNTLVKFGANPGRSSYKMAQASAKAVYDVRKKIADFFGVSEEENVIFTKNCTEALNMVLFGLLKEGDHVAVSDLEHNAVMRPLHELTKKGISFTVFETFEDDTKTLDSLRKALNDKTKLMVCTGASNVFGTRLPITRLCSLCKIYDIATCIDAAQIAGHCPIDMQEQNIDYLCVPSHKGLYGVMGSGVLICRKPLNPLMFGGTGVSSFDFDMPEMLPEKYESGTLNLPGIISIGAGIDFLNRIGINKLSKIQIFKMKKIHSELSKNKKIILYTPEPTDDKFVPVLSFNVKGKNCEEVGDYLSRRDIAVRSGIHCAPMAHKKMGTLDGTVRISLGVFSSDSDISAFLSAIKIYTKN